MEKAPKIGLKRLPDEGRGPRRTEDRDYLTVFMPLAYNPVLAQSMPIMIAIIQTCQEKWNEKYFNSNS